MTAHIHSLADFKTYQSISDTTFDAIFTILRNGIKDRIQAHCKRLFESASRTEKVYGKGYMIPLKALPVASITSVKIYSKGNNSTDYDTLENTEYDITPYGVELENPLTRGAWVEVVYTGGYSKGTEDTESDILIFSETDYSTNIKRAAMIQLAHEWNTRLKPGSEVISTDAGSINTSKLELLQEVKDALAPCIHPLLGVGFV